MRVQELTCPTITGWSEIETQTPELNTLKREFLLAHTHLTLATLRKNGSPRISNTEIILAKNKLWLGSMPNAVKALDLQHDPRFAVHSGSDDPDKNWKSNAKITNRVEEIEDEKRKQTIVDSKAPPNPMHLFRYNLTELVVIHLNKPTDHLMIES